MLSLRHRRVNVFISSPARAPDKSTADTAAPPAPDSETIEHAYVLELPSPQARRGAERRELRDQSAAPDSSPQHRHARQATHYSSARNPLPTKNPNIFPQNPVKNPHSTRVMRKGGPKRAPLPVTGRTNYAPRDNPTPRAARHDRPARANTRQSAPSHAPTKNPAKRTHQHPNPKPRAAMDHTAPQSRAPAQNEATAPTPGREVHLPAPSLSVARRAK
jgi:hypothetical protein